MDIFIHYLLQASRLHTLKLANNNLRGSVNDLAEKLILCFTEMTSIRRLDLSSNMLGQSYGTYPFNPKFQNKTPPACALGDVLINSTVKDLNVSNNLMEEKSAVSIAHGLKHSNTIKSIDVSGNPIGTTGMRLIMQAMSYNSNT